jgi:hypothetical protein
MGHRTGRKFARQVQVVREQLDQEPLVFGNSLSAEVVQDALREANVDFRERTYTPWITLWAFLNQVMSSDHSCRFAVCQVIAYLASQGRRVCSAATSTYCEARARLPEAFYQYLFRRVGRHTMEDAPSRWLCQGRPVKVVDGTTFLMPDTEANQQEYPQADPERPGLGFPIARVLVIFSLAVGTVLEAAIRPYHGKTTGELAMFRELSESLQGNDIVLGDKGFCSYCHVAWLHERPIDVVLTLNRSRLPNLVRIRKLAKNDVLYRWNKPKDKPEGFTAEEFATLPPYLEVRMITVAVHTRGFRPEQLEILTTLLDEKQFPPSEIAELYRRRWMCELYLRDLKTTLQMDKLRCETPEMVRKEIYAHLLAYNVIRTQLAQAAYYLSMLPHQISFKGTIQALTAFEAFCRNITRDELATKIATIGYSEVGKQPGRCEPRKLKRRPKYDFLTEPRDVARKQLAA